MTRWTVAGVVLLAAACGDDASQADGEGGSVTGQGGEAGGAPADAYAHLYECQEVAFEEGKRQVTVLDEEAGTTSNVDVRIQTGRATEIP